MQDTPILILDEPTTGLDPLMQTKFVDLIKKEKALINPIKCLIVVVFPAPLEPKKPTISPCFREKVENGNHQKPTV